jgi:DNA-directed RNA polymerase subunit RPC12/RpoP
VVRLFYTNAFEKDRLWKYAAEFKSQSGRKLGLKMTKRKEASGDIEVYCDPDISEDTKITFVKYIHEHLLSCSESVRRFRHYVCIECSYPVKDTDLAMSRLDAGGKEATIVCQRCGEQVALWDLLEERFASKATKQRVRELESSARAAIDNESKELILEGHARAVTGEAGQIYRGYTGGDHGIDGEIEFKDWSGKASGKRLYLQLKSGDSYLRTRSTDGVELFTISKQRWVEYWQSQSYPVMLVIRTSDGQIRWMNVTQYLRDESKERKKVTQIEFDGEPFSALNILRMRDRVLPRRG